MATLAQSAATFVAIIAGFYTTKIISISSEKKKVQQKILDIENEIKWRTKRSAILNQRKQGILREDEEEIANWFIDWITRHPIFAERINSEESILKLFNEVLERAPNEHEKEILKNKTKSIIENAKKRLREFYDPNSRITKLFSSQRSEADKFQEVIESRDERKEFQMLIHGITEEESRLEFLNEQYHSYQVELDSLIFPKHIKFGFISFITFAVLGVIIPITHSWWVDYFKEYSDAFAFSTFAVGLVLTFIYLVSEILSYTTKQNNSWRKNNPITLLLNKFNKLMALKHTKMIHPT